MDHQIIQRLWWRPIAFVNCDFFLISTIKIVKKNEAIYMWENESLSCSRHMHRRKPQLNRASAENSIHQFSCSSETGEMRLALSSSCKWQSFMVSNNISAIMICGGLTWLHRIRNRVLAIWRAEGWSLLNAHIVMRLAYAPLRSTHEWSGWSRYRLEYRKYSRILRCDAQATTASPCCTISTAYFVFFTRNCLKTLPFVLLLRCHGCYDRLLH